MRAPSCPVIGLLRRAWHRVCLVRAAGVSALGAHRRGWARHIVLGTWGGEEVVYSWGTPGGVLGTWPGQACLVVRQLQLRGGGWNF